MRKKLICGLLSALMLSAAVLPTAAATFPDVTETSYEWALTAVEEMVADKIIFGYPDNTFKPERTVSKIEALILSARILGYTDEKLSAFTAFATEFYADILEKYDTPYKGEIAFLLYKEVISEKELTFYIGGENANAGMRRYEVAKLLTRVIGGEDDINVEASTGEYIDSADIPADAKPYVRYVTDMKIMNGMDDGRFEPMGEVNRAQIATLLYRIRNLLAETYTLGTVKEVDSELENIIFVNEEGADDRVVVPYNVVVRVKQDGYSEDFSRIALGADLLITKRGGILYSFDTLTREPDEEFEGAISSIITSGKERTISVFPIKDSNDVRTYTIADDVAVSYEGSPAKLIDLKRGQAVKLQIREGKVAIIEAKESERSIKGVIEKISLEPSLSFDVRLTNGDIEKYFVSDDVSAKRNGSAVEINEILVGDKVTITLRYEEVVSVVATSSKFITQGTVEEIRIATLPSIKIRANNAISEYSLSRDCVYTIDGKNGTIYDLRLGASITASVDSETVTSLTTTAPATTAATTGTIENINTSYGFFTLAVLQEDGTTANMQVFTKRDNLKVINSEDGTSKDVKDLKIGMKVSVTGLTSSGAFEATAIIIMPAE